jgi:hypothetical protein
VLLLLFGIFIAKLSDGINGNMKELELAAGYKKRWLILVGDGLSMIRMRLFRS